MSQLQTIFDNPITIIISFFAVIYAIKEFDGLLKWFKEKLNGYHEEEKQEESIEERINTISKVSEEHTKALEELSQKIDFLCTNLEKMGDEHRKSQMISDRATIYHLYETLKDREELSFAEYECFSEVSDRYLKNGGNGPFKKEIIPFILDKCKNF